jgi:CheY-like chemotaxis protein
MIFAGKETGTPETVDVSSLVIEMTELLKVSISKHAVLTTSLPSGLPPVSGNPAQIRQVVMNLVINASEAIGERDGMIRVVTQRVTVGPGSDIWTTKNLRHGEYIQLEVGDTGCGMAPETQRRAFDPFFTTKFAGRGMGLAVVQQIVHHLGGGTHVVSSDQGTRILVLLPCGGVTTKSTVSSSSFEQVREAQPPIGTTVLIVEDEPAMLGAVSKLLGRKGFGVLQASNGTTALELIRDAQRHIDAMLLDVTLPGVPSRQVFEESVRLRPALAVILTSAYSKESIEASFIGLKPAPFIRKPFLIDDLIILLEGTLSARSLVLQVEPHEPRPSVSL